MEFIDGMVCWERPQNPKSKTGPKSSSRDRRKRMSRTFINKKGDQQGRIR